MYPSQGYGGGSSPLSLLSFTLGRDGTGEEVSLQSCFLGLLLPKGFLLRWRDACVLDTAAWF